MLMQMKRKNNAKLEPCICENKCPCHHPTKENPFIVIGIVFITLLCAILFIALFLNDDKSQKILVDGKESVCTVVYVKRNSTMPLAYTQEIHCKKE